MFKTTLAKVVLATALAVPAAPLFAQTTHHKLIVHHKTHHALVSRASRRRLISHNTRHMTLSLHKKGLLHRGGISTHRLAHKSGTRSTAMSSTPHFKVHVTKMPPTIDGINA
jgi:hypothetical protein